MKMSYEDYNKAAIDRICDMFEYTEDVHYISSNLIIPYNMVLSIIISSGKYDDLIKDHQCQLDIKDKKFILISDTHYGSVYNNINYANDVFDFAKANGINTIFHGGDIIEGTSNNTNELINNDRQVELFLSQYPSDKSIKTYAVLGNHDYLAIRPKSLRYHMLDSREDIDIMGFKKVFVDWNGLHVGLKHKVEKYKLNLGGVFYEDLCFKGHAHYYLTREYDSSYHINIPALCNDPTHYMNKQDNIDMERVFEPGFITAEKFDDYIVVTNYYFDDNNYIVKGSEHPLVKKYKNTSI